MNKTYPLYGGRLEKSLDGLWDFHFFDQTVAPSLAAFVPTAIAFDAKQLVPGVFDATVPLASKRGIGVYRSVFELEADGRHLLRCGGFLLAAAVYIDGVRIGSTDLPYSYVDFEFTASRGRHEIVVAVDNRFSATPLWLDYYDFYAFGGILRGLAVLAIPESAIERCEVIPLDLEGRVRMTLRFDSAVPDGDLAVSYAFDGGEAVSATVMVREGKALLEALVPDPSPWTPETPNLHTVTVRTATCAVTERFGIRTVKAEKGRILLNGRPIRLLGYNRHESDPDFGPATPRQLQLQDLQLLREAGCNFIRGCHYTQDEGFLDLCDAMGFLVWEESLGWGNQQQQLPDRAFFDRQVDQTARMVRRAINHPCVIIWAFMNECASDFPQARPLIKALSDTVRENDASRLVSFASNRYEKDVCLDFVDVISFNLYPGWYGCSCDDPHPSHLVAPTLGKLEAFFSQPRYADKPMLISEIGAAAIYNNHDRFHSQWSEEYQAELLDVVCRHVVDSPRLSGVALWMWADSRSYVFGLNRVRGFNNKGSLDEYRRPKLGYDVVSGIFSKTPKYFE